MFKIIMKLNKNNIKFTLTVISQVILLVLMIYYYTG